MRRVRTLAAQLALGALAWSPLVSAQGADEGGSATPEDQSRETPPDQRAVEEPEASKDDEPAAEEDPEPPSKRPVPDYDGRGPGARPGDSPAFLPLRVLLSPLYFFTEFLVNRPLGALMTKVERDRWPGFVHDLFSGPSGIKLTVLPSAYVEFGFRPSVGLYVFWDEAFAKQNDIRFRVVTWGPDWVDAGVADRVRIVGSKGSYSRLNLWVRSEIVRRLDRAYFGIGPDARESSQTRYGSQLLDLNIGLEQRYGTTHRLRTFVGLREREFRNSGCCSEPGIRRGVREGLVTLPPGFGGYTSLYQRAEYTMETRPRRPAPQTGVRTQLEVEPGFDTFGDARRGWVRYRGTVGLFADVTGSARQLGLVTTAMFADPLTGDVPFTEQAQLGGGRFFKAFRSGRMVDRSALVSTLKYEWPIWTWLDADLRFELGNVFGEHLEGFRFERMRMGTGFALRTVDSPDHQLESFFGWGSQTIEQGGRFNAFRFYIGLTRGF